MSTYENGLYSYIEGRLSLLEKQGKAYFFRNNSFAGRIMRYNGSQGYINNAKRGAPDVVACIKTLVSLGPDIRGIALTGLFVGFELKAPKGRLTLHQTLAKKAIEDAGGRYYLIRSPEDFEEALRELGHA